MIQIKHNICGNIYETRAGNLLSGKGCPYCKESKGEKKIREVLDILKVKYKEQYRITYSKTFFKVDFMVYDKNNNIILGIEFDGKQHFEPIEFFGGEERFEKQRNMDKLKNQWFEENGISMLRIPYWDYDNIEEILKGILV